MNTLYTEQHTGSPQGRSILASLLNSSSLEIKVADHSTEIRE
jgi:hypothetical protein